MTVDDQQVVMNNLRDKSVLVAFVTSALSMGANIDDVAAVIVIDSPYSIVTLQQIFGRAYRGGKLPSLLHYAKCIWIGTNAIVSSDAISITAKEEERDQYELQQWDHRVLSHMLHSAECKAKILDQHTPPFQINGKLISQELPNCGICISCILGTEDLDAL
jgi:superfamily II DNA helicase RecQ